MEHDKRKLTVKGSFPSGRVLFFCQALVFTEYQKTLDKIEIEKTKTKNQTPKTTFFNQGMHPLANASRGIFCVLHGRWVLGYASTEGPQINVDFVKVCFRYNKVIFVTMIFMG
jgi:hypothetical protein